jgi:hypothetical protein
MPDPKRRFLQFSTDTLNFPWHLATPLDGLHAAAAIALALLIGQRTGHASAGAIAAGAVFSIGFAAFHRALASALLSMGLLTLGLASATLAGSLAAAWTPLVLLVILIATLNYGLLSFLGPTEGWMGMQCGVFVIVASYFPHGLHYAVGRSLMILTGGALQMLTYALCTSPSAATTAPKPPPSLPASASASMSSSRSSATTSTSAAKPPGTPSASSSPSCSAPLSIDTSICATATGAP